VTNPLDRVPPHVVIADFLPATDHAALIDWTLANQARFEPSGLGHERALDTGFRNSLSLRGEGPRPWVSPLTDRIRPLVPGWCAALGIAPFTIDQIEFDMVAYNDGAFYRRHVDTGVGGGRTPQPGSAAFRMITAVHYFHREPKRFQGGALRLHSLAHDISYGDVPPSQNSLAIFPAWARHEVMPVACPSRDFADSRFAINCWVRRAAVGAAA
jgi:SM-20-related protein